MLKAPVLLACLFLGGCAGTRIGDALNAWYHYSFDSARLVLIEDRTPITETPFWRSFEETWLQTRPTWSLEISSSWPSDIARKIYIDGQNTGISVAGSYHRYDYKSFALRLYNWDNHRLLDALWFSDDEAKNNEENGAKVARRFIEAVERYLEKPFSIF